MADTDRPAISILIVDDDTGLLTTLRRMLESAGYEIRSAENAAAGIAAITERSPELILTDVYMPGADGFELINWLRARPVQIPVIAMSGTATTRYDQLGVAEHLGATAVIEKPFRQSEILDLVARVLAERGKPPR